MENGQTTIDYLMKLLKKYEDDKNRAEKGIEAVMVLLKNEGYSENLIKRDAPIVGESKKMRFRALTADDLLNGMNQANFKDATIPKKILYSLKLIKKGTYKDVAKKLKELDPQSFPSNKAERNAQNFLSKMNVEHIIKSQKIGLSNIYEFV